MKGIYIVIVFLFIFCGLSAQNESVTFAQSEYFQLATPKIKCESVLFRERIKVELEMDNPDTEIKYAIDSGKWLKYELPIFLEKSSTVSAKAVHKEIRESEIVQKEFHKIGHDISGSKIKIKPEPNGKYVGGGKYSLIDLKIGDSDFQKKWLGFQSDTVEVDLFFEKELDANSVTFSILRNQSAWIFLPEKIELFSDDKLLAELKIEKPIGFEKNGRSFLTIDFLPQKISRIHIRIINSNAIPDWHPGAGAKPWLFLDEILLM